MAVRTAVVSPKIMGFLGHACACAAPSMAEHNSFGVAVAPFAFHLALLALGEFAQLLVYVHRRFEITHSGNGHWQNSANRFQCVPV